MFDTFPHSHQLESADCGPSCLRMIAKYYGRSYSIQYLREQAFNQTTNILISFLAARAVVSGEMTLGCDDVADVYRRYRSVHRLSRVPFRMRRSAWNGSARSIRRRMRNRRLP